MGRKSRAKAQGQQHPAKPMLVEQRCEMYAECSKPWSEVVVSVRGWHKRLCRYHSADIQRIMNIGCGPDRNEVAAVYGADHLPLEQAQASILAWMEADGR
jgi:hypothetical protein